MVKSPFKVKLLNQLRKVKFSRNPQSKQEWEAPLKSQVKQGSNLHFVTNTDGYKDAFEYFEDQINSLYRSKEVDFDYIRGIEAVFQYFESGKEMKEKAQTDLDEYKDEV